MRFKLKDSKWLIETLQPGPFEWAYITKCVSSFNLANHPVCMCVYGYTFVHIYFNIQNTVC